jgi:hypothetical protein
MKYLATLGIALAAFFVPAAPAGSAAHLVKVNDWISTYDKWNNSPPGCGIEYAKKYGYPTIHNCAGGIGSYANPITFASQKNEWAPGTRIYIPLLQRYFMKEDWCATCYTDKDQTDLWLGGVSASQEKSTDPHNAVNWWFQTTIIVNPPDGYKVETGPLRNVTH